MTSVCTYDVYLTPDCFIEIRDGVAYSIGDNTFDCYIVGDTCGCLPAGVADVRINGDVPPTFVLDGAVIDVTVNSSCIFQKTGPFGVNCSPALLEFSTDTNLSKGGWFKTNTNLKKVLAGSFNTDTNLVGPFILKTFGTNTNLKPSFILKTFSTDTLLKKMSLMTTFATDTNLATGGVCTPGNGWFDTFSDLPGTLLTDHTGEYTTCGYQNYLGAGHPRIEASKMTVGDLSGFSSSVLFNPNKTSYTGSFNFSIATQAVAPSSSRGLLWYFRLDAAGSNGFWIPLIIPGGSDQLLFLALHNDLGVVTFDDVVINAGVSTTLSFDITATNIQVTCNGTTITHASAAGGSNTKMGLEFRTNVTDTTEQWIDTLSIA